MSRVFTKFIKFFLLAGRDLVEKPSFGSKPNELTIVLTPYIKRQFQLFIKVVETAKFSTIVLGARRFLLAQRKKANRITAKPKLYIGVAKCNKTYLYSITPIFACQGVFEKIISIYKFLCD